MLVGIGSTLRANPYFEPKPKVGDLDSGLAISLMPYRADKPLGFESL